MGKQQKIPRAKHARRDAISLRPKIHTEGIPDAIKERPYARGKNPTRDFILDIKIYILIA